MGWRLPIQSRRRRYTGCYRWQPERADWRHLHFWFVDAAHDCTPARYCLSDNPYERIYDYVAERTSASEYAVRDHGAGGHFSDVDCCYAPGSVGRSPNDSVLYKGRHGVDVFTVAWPSSE